MKMSCLTQLNTVNTYHVLLGFWFCFFKSGERVFGETNGNVKCFYIKTLYILIGNSFHL